MHPTQVACRMPNESKYHIMISTAAQNDTTTISINPRPILLQIQTGQLNE